MLTKNTLRWFFFLVGVILALLAYILKNKGYILPYDIMKDFAVIMSSIALLDWIWNAVGSELGKKDSDKKESVEVFLNLKEVEKKKDKFWLDLIKKTEDKIDLQGLSLSFFVSKEEFVDAIKKKVLSGVNVRIVIMAPDNPLADEKFFLFPDEIKNLSIKSAEIFEKIQNEVNSVKNKKGHFTYSLVKNFPISMALRRFDDKLYILPYIHNLTTLNTPVIFVKGEKQKLFRTFINSFNMKFSIAEK